MDDLRDLTVIIKSRFPLVSIESFEEPRAVSLLERVASPWLMRLRATPMSLQPWRPRLSRHLL